MLTLFLGLIGLRHLTPVHRRLLVFVAFTLFMEYLASSALTKFYFSPESNSPWYHLLTPPLYFCYVRIAGPTLFASEWPWLRWVLLGSITGLTVANAFWGDGFYYFPSLIVGVYSITGILWAAGYFLHLLRTLSVRLLERDPLFWMSCGFLIYFSGNFLNWLSFNFVAYEPGFYTTVISINHGLIIFLNVLLIISIGVGRATTGEQTTVNNSLVSL
ncbi:hypothetical protein [Neolewinella antarctica]|uniref:Uncharacterized protein n=1 Tax=Neolewinella antarctica TaxID=442734 RepID=A0ABX0X7C8_9BACT|nr:hypothetical protein [Neolewinella antarctica]NJC24913.1 hypothetical protein [Neolewinella antarctica]